MKLENDNTLSDRSVDRIKNYSLRIGERFYKRLSKHILYLKQLNSIQNQQQWLERAILTKLKKEEEQDIDACILPEKYLSFKMGSHIDTRIEKRVEVIRKVRVSFSKKQWILEAIHEMLDAEEKETREKAQELLKEMLKETSESPSK